MQPRFQSQINNIVWQSLESRPLLMLDEMHEDERQLHTLAELLPAAAQAGAKHVCIEYPIALQPIIDAYEQKRITKAELTEFLDYIGFKSPVEHTEIIEAARNEGLKIHAVDYRFHENVPKYNELYNRIAPEASPDLKREIDAYFALANDVAENVELPDTLAASLIKKRVGSDKALIIYGSAHLTNLNLAKTHGHNYHLSAEFPGDSFTYVRIKSSRESFNDEIEEVATIEDTTVKIGDKNRLLACNSRSRMADYIAVIDEGQAYITPLGLRRNADGADLPVWGGPYICAKQDWDELLAGLKSIQTEDKLTPNVLFPIRRPALIRN